jgi:hypothetical protein
VEVKGSCSRRLVAVVSLEDHLGVDQWVVSFLFGINNIDHVLERERTMKEKRGREEQSSRRKQSP